MKHGQSQGLKLKLYLLGLTLIGVTMGSSMAADKPGAKTVLVANKAAATLEIFKGNFDKPKAVLPTGDGPHEVAVSPDKKFAIVSNYGRQKPGNTLSVYNIKKAKELRVIDLGKHTRPHGMQWLESGQVAVTTEGSQSLILVDPMEGKITQVVETGQRVAHMVVVSPDGTTAWVANIGSDNVTVVDLTTGTKVKDIPTGKGAEGIAMTPDGSQVWVGNRAEDTITIIDAKAQKVLQTVPCKGFPIRVTATPDGKAMLVSCAATGEVARFDVATKKEVARQKLSFEALPEAKARLFADQFGSSPVPVGLQVSPDGARAYIAATQSDVLVVMDPVTLEMLDTIRTGDEPDGMSVF